MIITHRNPTKLPESVPSCPNDALFGNRERFSNLIFCHTSGRLVFQTAEPLEQLACPTIDQLVSY